MGSRNPPDYATSKPVPADDKPDPAMSDRHGPQTLEKFDIISKFCIAAAGLALSGAIGFSTIYFNHQATERQANGQIEALVLLRRSSTAQIELSLLPVFTHGTDAERQLALSILASLAPDEAERVGALVIPQLKTEALRREVTQLISSVPEKKRQQEFRQRLQNAALYRQSSLDANACREYFAAFESLSSPEKNKVATEVERARRDYSRGQFSDAATRLQRLFNTM
jgi:hypothetical protein